MSPKEERLFWVVLGIGLVVFFLFSLCAKLSPGGLEKAAVEDGPIETGSAIFYGLSSLGFFLFARRSTHLKRMRGRFRYFFTIAWAVLMFIFMGEELSWGQRIFHYKTPTEIAEHNEQGEMNLHNLYFIDNFEGGKYRFLSAMMILTGLIFPFLALFSRGKQLIQKWAFPVVPFAYWIFFMGAYIYGKVWAPYVANDAAEVREFLLSVGTLAFAWHGVFEPCALFRTCAEA